MSDTKTNNYVNIISDATSMKADFSDFIQLEANAERVIINFLQILPDQGEQDKSAQVIKRIAVSWPHFARLTQICVSALEQKKEDVKNHVIEVLSLPEKP